MSVQTMQIELVNQTVSYDVYAYITGSAIDQGNQLMLISADGKTPYFPPSPPAGTTVQPLQKDCAIPLGPPGTSVFCTIPHIAGCRVWLSVNSKLTFRLNPGPALVEPSCTNPSDPDINHWWDFAELTFNADQCFANISYVDFVCLPISITLTTYDGKKDHVSGMATNGLDNVCRALKGQAQIDGQPWTELIIKNAQGKPLRVLSPNNATVMNGNLFQNYMKNYVDQVYDYYTAQPLNVDTQAQWGRVKGKVSNAAFNFDGQIFSKPSTGDILSCSTGPFGGGPPEKLAIIPRLSAAFNRGTLPNSNVTPDPAGPTTYYQNAICNHYARIVHEQCLDGRGYAFPYDDVCQDGGPDQCGAVYDGQPKVLTIAVGGNGAYVAEDAYGRPMYN